MTDKQDVDKLVSVTIVETDGCNLAMRADVGRKKPCAKVPQSTREDVPRVAGWLGGW